MDTDAVIGRLYRELEERKQENAALIALVTGLKSGEIAIERVGVSDGGGITLKPQLEAVEATA